MADMIIATVITLIGLLAIVELIKLILSQEDKKDDTKR